MTGCLHIDGSMGEGGGQLVRSALALSCLTGIPVEINNIRAGRSKPGLRPQHLAVVRILADMTSADVSGGYIGSMRLSFSPGEIKGGKYSIDIGTAGSLTLLMQAAIPVALASEGEVEISALGGTDVPHAPTAHYFTRVFCHNLHSLGLGFDIDFPRKGYYPRGEGSCRLHSPGGNPIRSMAPIRPESASEFIAGEVFISNLDDSIAVRIRESALETLEGAGVPVDLEIKRYPASGPGVGISLYTGNGIFRRGSDGLGRKGLRSEDLGSETARRLLSSLEYHTDPHLSDQMLLFLSIASGEYTAPYLTSHARTLVELINIFASRSSAVRRVSYEKHGSGVVFFSL